MPLAVMSHPHQRGSAQITFGPSAVLLESSGRHGERHLGARFFRQRVDGPSQLVGACRAASMLSQLCPMSRPACRSRTSRSATTSSGKPNRSSICAARSFSAVAFVVKFKMAVPIGAEAALEDESRGVDAHRLVGEVVVGAPE